MNENQINKMLEIGSEWQKNNMHRIYFNDIAALYGLHTSHYNTGNISGATLDGEKISNTSARKLAVQMVSMKIWYDFADDKFHGKWYDSDYDAKDIFAIVTSEIKKIVSVEMVEA